MALTVVGVMKGEGKERSQSRRHCVELPFDRLRANVKLRLRANVHLSYVFPVTLWIVTFGAVS